MAKKRKAVKKARKTAKPKASKPKAARASSTRSTADEGFFAAFLKLFGPPETDKRKR